MFTHRVHVNAHFGAFYLLFVSADNEGAVSKISISKEGISLLPILLILFFMAELVKRVPMAYEDLRWAEEK